MKRNVTKASKPDKTKHTSNQFSYSDNNSSLPARKQTQAVAEAPAATVAGTIAITKYQHTRFWAVWLNDELLAVVCYKKGARAIRDVLMKAILSVALCLFAGETKAACFTGTVTRVIDGDTIVVGTNIVRLAEIDAPEMKTPFGRKAKAALSGMISNKVVVVTWSKPGRYRRIIGQVYLTEKMDLPASVQSSGWVNRWMIEQGWAWQFKRYSRSKMLAAAEQSARERLLGTWRRLDQL